MKLPNCVDCRFSTVDTQPTGQEVRFCRRNPPTCVPVIMMQPISLDEQRAQALRGEFKAPITRQVQVMRSLWPAVAPSDWCHQFEPATLPSH